ncbi:DUF1990 family protein [Haloactinomyces albus]|uniref:DUF1990 domain-containing protein n=1 Tax=Haloactinomyces albus TaxID=1352928 RepID=A0AAE3ZI46_9ACTN|nr:DUF1990 family protein [Haloactinomyces albus]MDR7304013.1 hypothetical protein [Haloactinomyces albus]
MSSRVQWNWLFRWPPGIALTTLRYFLRPLPTHRVDEHEIVVVPELPEGCGSGIQTPERGSGRLFHRRYSVRIGSSLLEPEQLMCRLMADPNAAVPSEAALFETDVDHDSLRFGEELVVRMPGPWDGPVRVVHTSPTSFRLATLYGHLEAGQIEFRAARHHEELLFAIESWARSSDGTVDLFYDGINLFKELQTYLWARYCERVCELCGGQLVRNVEIYTGCER